MMSCVLPYFWLKTCTLPTHQEQSLGDLGWCFQDRRHTLWLVKLLPRSFPLPRSFLITCNGQSTSRGFAWIKLGGEVLPELHAPNRKTKHLWPITDHPVARSKKRWCFSVWSSLHGKHTKPLTPPSSFLALSLPFSALQGTTFHCT